MNTSSNDRRRGSQPVEGQTATDEVDRFLQERDALPKRCPAWCIGQHVDALEEGADLADASRHVSTDYAVVVRPQYKRGREVQQEILGSVRTEIFAAQGEHHWESPVIELETSMWNADCSNRERAAIPLSSGDARVLSRQLLDLADRIDL